ncbi:Coiled-coil domain-containing protein 177 [Frankliniella fusca]|uniref:Coiled-coil domain-containing protein 177 n=1 Tax=Frankliniella fusca TaxID=407009 RepID=A0AAE1H504_9NEOP|nr:Coiled-coil domain-containing protein 177 [Frankliniella fusca]
MVPVLAVQRHWQWCSMQVERRLGGGRSSPEPAVAVSSVRLDKLDLFNFDSAPAWDSPVVLTSPRSLAACRRAGVKPVELLYRSEQEVLSSLPPGVPPAALQAVHRRAEEERQAKLHACRAIRHQMILRQQRATGVGVGPQGRQTSPSTDPVATEAAAGIHDRGAFITERNAALVGPLFPVKRDVLRASSPGVSYGYSSMEARKQDYDTAVSPPERGRDVCFEFKRDVFETRSSDLVREKEDVVRTPSPRTRRRSASPEVKREVLRSLENNNERTVSEAKRHVARAPSSADLNKVGRVITFSSPCSTPPSSSSPSRKELLDRENASRIESQPALYSRQGSRLESRQDSKPGSRLDLRLGGLAISPNLSTSTSPARSVRSLRSTPASEVDRPRTVLVDCWGQAKSVRAQRPPPATPGPHPRRRQPRPPSSGTPSSLSESRCSSRRSRRRAARIGGGGRRSLLLLLRGLRGPPASCPSPRKAASSTAAMSVVVQDCDSGRGSSTFHSCENALQSLRISASASRLGTASPSDLGLGSWLPGSVLGLGLVDEVPEHDRRILESMAMKKQQERRDEEVAHRAHQLWERERRQRRQEEVDRAAKWQASVNARRQWEAKENARRMEAVKRSLRLAQQRLRESIRLKEERVQLRVLEEDVQRMVLQGERSKEYAARRLEVEEKLLHIQEGEAKYRCLLDEELRARQAEADRRRRRTTERERLRAASANREWERCRLERASALALQAEESARVLRASARDRHQRAAANKGRIRRRRQQRALQASLEREAKHSDARAMHADLEHGLQLWRERCAALQEGAALRAQERAREHREHARARLRRSNQRRRRHHRALHARVQAEEEGRRRAQRQEIRDKDQRIRQLGRLRERAVQESREQAFATASLREELR